MSNPPEPRTLTIRARRVSLLDWLRYGAECILWIVLLPIGLVNFEKRMRQGRYRGIFWLRFFGGARPCGTLPRILLMASGLGETKSGMLTAVGLAKELGEPVALLSQLSKSYGELPVSTQEVQVGYAPFEGPLSALMCLLRWRPRHLLFVGSPCDPHLAFWAKFLGRLVGLIHVYLSDNEVEKLKRRKMNQWDLQRIDWFAVQSPSHAKKLSQFTIAADSVVVSGPLLSPSGLSQSERNAIRSQWSKLLGLPAGSKVVVAGSTHPQEEPILLDAMAMVWEKAPDALLMLAPRRIERVPEVSALLRERGVQHQLRSELSSHPPLARCVILDTAGELADLYSISSVAFVGGTLDPTIGGHSFTQPLDWGVPLTSGPHYSHQIATVELLLDGNSLTVCEDASSLADAWVTAFGQPNIQLQPLEDRSIPTIASAIRD